MKPHATFGAAITSIVTTIITVIIQLKFSNYTETILPAVPFVSLIIFSILYWVFISFGFASSLELQRTLPIDRELKRLYKDFKTQKGFGIDTCSIESQIDQATKARTEAVQTME